MAEGTVLRELYLIRHGESTGNAGIDAQTPLDGFDPVLSPKGEDQADRLGKLVKDYGFDAVPKSWTFDIKKYMTIMKLCETADQLRL